MTLSVRLVLAAAALAVAGCATPTAPTSAPAAVSLPPTTTDALAATDASATTDASAAQAPGEAPRAAYGLAQAADEPLGVIVRWKAGHAGKKPPRGRLKRALKLERTDLVEAVDATQRDALLLELKADPAVEWAEPDHRVHAFATANDPMLSYQWAVPKTNLLAAWDLGRGGGVTVAVIDTGVDASHPDLAGQVVAGPDLVQDDGNPADDQGHGTHVAGTIAALANNGVGVAGFAPQAKVLAVKALAADGSGSTSDIADAVVAAYQRGAKVLNLSLGGPSYSSALATAVAQAQQAGAVVVAAAGNDGVDVKSYPAAYPGVLAVGATTSTDARASFSNYGSWVTVAAPGDRIASTARGGGYVYMSGTSMATPHVAALAALLRAKRPDWTVAQVRDAIQTTGVTPTGFTGNAALKRIDALAAMRAAGTTTTSPSPTPTPAPTATDTTAPSIWSQTATNVKATTATVTWTTSEAADGQVEYGKTTALGSKTAIQTTYGTWHSFGLSALSRGTTYYYRVRSKDRAGNLAVSPTKSFKTTW